MWVPPRISVTIIAPSFWPRRWRSSEASGDLADEVLRAEDHVGLEVEAENLACGAASVQTRIVFIDDGSDFRIRFGRLRVSHYRFG
jgi:hypothetical protein